MAEQNGSPAHVRSALFVDFDNIYLGLQREDPSAAEQFATNPSHWLLWLQENLPHEDGGDRRLRQSRKVLFRRCYLNPSQFGRFRPYFTRSAFEVVDCPPLTSGGKTSADIHMVMDILDTLLHPTRFDEFIILSGDADFTPVLLRLSKHDRRSAVLAIGPASVAYKAACDLLIDQDTFLEEAIGVSPSPSSRAGETARNTAMEDLLRRIADKVYERAVAVGELVATDLPGIFREFTEFTASTNWLGFNSLRGMATAVTQTRPDLAMIEGDPWKVQAGEPVEGESVLSPAERPARLRPVTDYVLLTEEILEYVRSVVETAETAVPMARAAQMVISRFGEEVLDSRWAGAGTFRDLLEGRADPGFSISSLKPGYVYDSERHALPSDGQPEELALGDPHLNSLAHRIHQLTDTPYLRRDEYARVFRLIAREVNEHGYFLTRTSKAVRDRCVDEDSPIARASVNFILRGITFSGHRFGQNGPEKPQALGDCFFRNVLSLCESAGLTLDPGEREVLRDWILGDLGREDAPDAPALFEEDAFARGGALEATPAGADEDDDSAEEMLDETAEIVFEAEEV
jgi:hypothetical protein